MQTIQLELPDWVPLLRYFFAAQSRDHPTIVAWKQGDFALVGANFRADGLGLRDEYQISGPELETMCDLARTVPGVLGERMLGGGDKGASGALVEQAAVKPLKTAIDRAYPLASRSIGMTMLCMSAVWWMVSVFTHYLNRFSNGFNSVSTFSQRLPLRP